MAIGISVVIPVYNVEKYLAPCLESVAVQTLSPAEYEIICVDDGSTDSSHQILQGFAARLNNLHIVRKENGGLSSARNAGLDAARGDYVFFLDSDDRLLGANALERLRARAAETEADLLIFSAEVEYETPACQAAQPGLRAHFHRNGGYPDGLTGRELFVRMSERRDYVPSSCMQLYRRAFLEEHRLRFAEGLLFEDQLFTLQCLTLARRTAQLDASFYLYFVREGSIMTGSKLRRQALDYYRIAARLRGFLERLPDCSPEFRRCYLARVRFLASQGTDCLRALPRAERSAALGELTPEARRLARADLARYPARALRRKLRRLKRRLRGK